MNTTQKIRKAINERADNSPSFAKEQYEDNYDGRLYTSWDKTSSSKTWRDEE